MAERIWPVVVCFLFHLSMDVMVGFILKDTEMDQQEFRTIKAAKEAGFAGIRNHEYGGEQILIKGNLLVRNPQIAKSESAWKKEGRKILPNQTPHAVRHAHIGKSIFYKVYRMDQTEPIIKNQLPTFTICEASA